MIEVKEEGFSKFICCNDEQNSKDKTMFSQ